MFWDIVLGLSILGLGAVLCVAGFRLSLVLLPIFGFFAGFWLGMFGVLALFGDGFFSSLMSWFAGFGVGLIVAALAYMFWYVAVAIVAAVAGASIGSGLMAAIGSSPGFLMALVAVIFAAAAIAAVIWLNAPKYVLMAFTALVGSGAVIGGSLVMFSTIEPSDLQFGVVGAAIRNSLFWGLCFLLLAGAGIVAQYRTADDYEFDTPTSRVPGHSTAGQRELLEDSGN